MRYSLNKASAFTFLELILAMALMSVVAASLYASLSIGFKARRSSESAVEPVRKAELVMELLSHDIEAALPPTGILAGEFIGTDEQDSTGSNSDTLLFYSSAHEPGAEEIACDIRKIELALGTLSDTAERVLVRRITTNLLAPKVLEPNEEILCRGVMSFNLRYFDGFDWLDSWDSVGQGNLLPRAVEASIEVERRDKDISAESGYQSARVFLIPCSRAAAEEGIEMIQRF
jgi:prepilin-type N-terminal cleavage/methylation domain-containing protein